ncbi:MAG: tetratricopeptide repeat protein [Candidatus Latescibacteria bacterium]|nr:tetratricopeptide repeat protein [Candidatus Latescibacterota bacterium]
MQTIVATFTDAFPHVAMWELIPGIDYLLVGSTEPVEVGLDRLATRLERPGVQRDLARSGGGDALDLLCSYVMGDQGIQKLANDAPLNTDDNARLEFAAPRGLYRDLSRGRGLFSLADLAAVRRADLGFVHPAATPQLARAWAARHLALEGLIRERRGAYSEALAQMGEAARLRPEDIEVQRVFPELSFKLAEHAIRRGRFQQAVRLYDELLTALPDHSVGHYRKGELHEHLRQWDQRTTELTPTFVAAHLRLGAIHTRNRAFDQAAATYRRGLAALPEHLGLLNNLGTTLLMQERFAEGLSVFRQALAIDSTDARVWNNLGTAFLKQRQFAEAQHYLSGAVQRRPEDAILWLKLADAYRRAGDVEKARQVLEEAPDDLRVRKMREQLGE